MPALPQRVIYYGRDKPLPPRERLRAGPLSLIFESGDLRYIRLGEREVIRRIYGAVRDQNWGTAPNDLRNLNIERAAESFLISYDVECRQDDIDFAWSGRITGNAKGTIQLTMEGVARSNFISNRIGICVLHPIRECAGFPCHIVKVDGSIEESKFPRHIASDPPFTDIRTISHEITPSIRAETHFEGEVFEMEDQRNLSDASFKIYSTPLHLPFPVEIKEGTTVVQSITLTLQGTPPVSPAQPTVGRLGESSNDGPTRTTPNHIVFSVDPSNVSPLPRIGLGCASHGRPLTDRQIERLETLRLSHFRVDLDLADTRFEHVLDQASEEARALATSLELALFLTDEADKELRVVSSALEKTQASIATCLVYHKNEKTTSAEWVETARTYLQGTGALIGTGTNAYYTQFTQNRPPIDTIDITCLSVNPQVHCYDNLSVMETLPIHGQAVQSARQFIGDLPLALTPITLRPRYNPFATGPEPAPDPRELPPQVDVRQMSLFGAGWTLGSLKYCGESDVFSVTYYETTGWRGVMEAPSGCPMPDKFRSIPDSVFPLYHVLADVGEFSDGVILATTSTSPLQVEGLTLRAGDRVRILLANLDESPASIEIECPGMASCVALKYLDETNAEEAMRDPEKFRRDPGRSARTSNQKLTLELKPFAVGRIDFTEV